MKSHFDIGVDVDGHKLSCDVDRLINTRMLIQAMSGGGKSWALRRVLEQSHGLAQQLVIDPEGEFASLRERFDYVLAARHGGDTVADPRTAKLLAERLLELGVSAILDIYELDPKERVSFVKVFLETVVDAPKSLWHRTLVVLDEAHTYCPQDGEAASADAVKGLATRGRKRGYCLIPATQRLSKLHKDVAAECGNKLIGRTTLDVDMKRAGDELGMGKAERLLLRDLDDGQFFAFGPALTRVVTKVHVGPVLTTHPKAGSRLAAAVPPPTERVRALLPKLSDLPAEAEARQRSEADLKAEILRLKRDLKAAKGLQPPAPKPVKAERVEVSILKDAHIAHLEQALKRVDAAVLPLRGVLDEILSLMHEAQKKYWPPSSPERPSNGPQRPQAQVSKRGSVPGNRNRLVASVDRSEADPAPDGEPITGPEQRILDAISWLNGVGVEEPEDTAVAFMARYSPGGGAYGNPKGRLRKRGLIEYKGNRIVLTRAGRGVAAIPPQDVTHEELQARVLEQLPGPEGRLLRPLLEAWPNALTDEELAKAANYAPGGGAFGNPKGRLRSLGLVEYPARGTVRARDILFLQEPT